MKRSRPELDEGDDSTDQDSDSGEDSGTVLSLRDLITVLTTVVMALPDACIRVSFDRPINYEPVEEILQEIEQECAIMHRYYVTAVEGFLRIFRNFQSLIINIHVSGWKENGPVDEIQIKIGDVSMEVMKPEE